MGSRSGNAGELLAESVVRRACAGESRAMESLCLHFEKPLFGYLYGMLRNAHSAQDAVQETLLRLFRMTREGRLNGQPALVRSLVFSIAHNLAVDELRRGRSKPEPAWESIAPPNPVERAFAREQIDHALAHLPDSHRNALMLRVWGELSYSEIADTLGATPAEIKIWLYRARKRLAELLDRDGQYIEQRTQ
ncbi:MAG: RNA polymerase sigma factor [Candidatus Hydrogenedentes bacterium]|nr:RNA polymerase sigma factor [Candidatus Hydrogenedentota bacterium]